MTIHVDIVSAEGAIFSGEADWCSRPAKMGELGIAPRHAPLLTHLQARRRARADERGREAVLRHRRHPRGPAAFGQVLADSALHAHELDESEALAARDRARELLPGKHEGVDLARAQAELVEAEARYRASQQLKGHRG